MDCQKKESISTVEASPMIRPANPAGMIMCVIEILREANKYRVIVPTKRASSDRKTTPAKVSR